MNKQAVTVIRLASFTRRVKKLFAEKEIEELAKYLSCHPEKGDIILGMWGLRKLRWSLQDHGKRTGSRVIYYYHSPESLVLLFSAYAKGQKADMDAAEKKLLKSALAEYFNE